LQIIKQIGNGNFGAVYLGEWKGLQVAMKTVKTNPNELLAEAEILAVIMRFN
jgi:predicted Ser/Thr protein kinase